MIEIQFYRTAAGACPVEEFLDGLNAKQAQKVEMLGAAVMLATPLMMLFTRAPSLALVELAGGLLILAAYRRAPVIVVAPMQYSQIIWAAVLGWIFFGERIDRPTAVGIAIIIASGLFLLARSGAPQPQAKPELDAT